MAIPLIGIEIVACKPALCPIDIPAGDADPTVSGSAAFGFPDNECTISTTRDTAPNAQTKEGL